MKGLLITLVIVLGGLLAFSFFRSSSEDTRADFDQQVIQEPAREETTPLPEENTENTPVVQEQEPALIIEPIENIKATNTPLPASINHPVTFFPQAPDGDRNLPRQEACEEASIALASYFAKGKSLSRDQMRADIVGLVDLQMDMFGDYIHTTIAQTKELYLAFYGGDAYIVDNPSVADIKSILAQGHVIVAPFAGRKLGNPHYSGQGPRYHMMVIRGYDDTYFYTNDVGTRRGENFRYTHATIMDAMHDLNLADINQGAKRLLVITQ